MDPQDSARSVVAKESSRVSPEESLWRVQDVARFLAVSTSWVYMAARSGVLAPVRVGRSVRFRPALVRALVQGEPGGKVVQLPRCR
jgi:excisionase family DNA binding protein